MRIKGGTAGEHDIMIKASSRGTEQVQGEDSEGWVMGGRS